MRLAVYELALLCGLARVCGWPRKNAVINWLLTVCSLFLLGLCMLWIHCLHSTPHKLGGTLGSPVIQLTLSPKERPGYPCEMDKQV